MQLNEITQWLDSTLALEQFDDASNNGLQIDRTDTEPIVKVAFGVDASVACIEAAAARGAQLLVVHHGVSWGGGIKRLVGGVHKVVAAAMQHNLALYAAHLPLDANPEVGNNYELARYLELTDLQPAFCYHGNVIGVTGLNCRGVKVGICSGGAGEFAEEAQRLGCELYITGEANWGEVIAAQNCGMPMVCAGHYLTETFGVKALARRMAQQLKVTTEFIEFNTEEQIQWI